jgi:hypothetical protein
MIEALLEVTDPIGAEMSPTLGKVGVLRRAAL